MVARRPSEGPLVRRPEVEWRCPACRAYNRNPTSAPLVCDACGEDPDHATDRL